MDIHAFFLNYLSNMYCSVKTLFCKNHKRLLTTCNMYGSMVMKKGMKILKEYTNFVTFVVNRAFTRGLIKPLSQ